MKTSLRKDVWSQSKYYEIAGKGSEDFDHPSMKKLAEVAQGAKTILDMGCGEGTRLNNLVGVGQVGYGIDISQKAIVTAKKKYPRLSFRVGDLERLPYKDEAFDLVYSAFVFEHLDNPKKIIDQGLRVLKKNGKIMIVAPNFGAPNRASPPFKGSRIVKLIGGFINDIFPKNDISWHKVTPIATAARYEIDWDTTVEPYLGSLLRYLKSKGVRIVDFSSFWGEDSPMANLMQKKFKILGEMGIYPFNLWGPHMAVVGQK